jgi:hypothetical protein
MNGLDKNSDDNKKLRTQYHNDLLYLAPKNFNLNSHEMNSSRKATVMPHLCFLIGNILTIPALPVNFSRNSNKGPVTQEIVIR